MQPLVKGSHKNLLTAVTKTLAIIQQCGLPAPGAIIDLHLGGLDPALQIFRPIPFLVVSRSGASMLKARQCGSALPVKCQ